MKRGEIYYADLRPVVGSEQGGIRPVLIIQNDVGNKYSPTTIVAILTSKEKPSLPTHVLLKSSEENGLEVDSTIELEQLRTIDKKRIKDKVGKISEYDNNRVLNALKVSMCI